jgi:predicted RNA-binding protein YlqC (UPF0109 family)
MHDTSDSVVQDLLLRIVSALVDRTDAIRITTTQSLEGMCFSILVHKEDVGKLIGRQGHTARSLRTIISGVGMKSQRRYEIDIVESDL